MPCIFGDIVKTDMTTVLIHDGENFNFLMPQRKQEFATCIADDPQLANKVLLNIYARKMVWRVSFSGDFSSRERSVWERFDLIYRAHHYLRAGKIVTIGENGLIGFSARNLIQAERMINSLFPLISEVRCCQHALSLGVS